MTESSLPEKGLKRRALIVAGEASGDHHGASLIEAAREIDPGISFFGVGGPLMEKAGCDVLIPYEELMASGFVEVIGHFPSILSVFRRLKKILNGHERPDVLVLIDYPDFNLRLAKHAKRAGVPVLFFVSPQVWAWRKGRVRRIAEAVDRLAVIFPFEPDLYRGLDVEVDYVGNPLMDEAVVSVDRQQLLQQLGVDTDTIVVGLFPGSRRHEIRYNLDTILKAAGIIVRRIPSARFLLPLAPFLPEDNVRNLLESSDLPITITTERIYDVANACDAVITAAGTATLQTAIMGTPMVILYRMSPVSYFIARRLIRIPHIGLANIVAGERIVAEFIQERATPGNIAGEVFRLLEDNDHRRRVVEGLSGIREKMGAPGCSERVAKIASEMSKKNSPEARV